MLERVEFPKETLPKAAYKERYNALIERLVVLQQEAVSKGVGLVVLFEGWNGAGKGSRISDLMYNLDARATSVYVTPEFDGEDFKKFPGRKNDVTGFYPMMMEFWQALGERGHITFYDRGWYSKATEIMLSQTHEELVLPKEGTRHYLQSIKDFEQQLTNDGYVVVKFFMHVRKKAQLKRLNNLYDNTDTRWRVPDKKLFSVKDYNETYKLYDRLLEGSDFDFAPWILIDGEDKRRSNLIIAETLVDAIEDGLAMQIETQQRRVEEQEELKAIEYEVLKAEMEADEALKASGSAETFQSADADEMEFANYVASKELDDSPLFLNEPEQTGMLNILGLVTGKRRDKKKKARKEETSFEIPRGPSVEKASEEAEQKQEQFATSITSSPEAIAQAAAQHAFAPQQSRFEIIRDYPQVEQMQHTLTIEPEEYKSKLKKLQKELFALENKMFQARIPLIVMYEGWDAAGKGGNIKRVAQALDARAYTIVPSPAPTKPELAHPHLWRYWTRLPKAGHVAMYDRSWYGRVLVERVEEITSPERWSQGYDEINEFEHDLTDWGAILLKFWVDVSADEQLARFHAREKDPAKQWKITPDDWRNREKYPQYKSAIDDMFRLTSTTYAPWTVLESDDKRYARVKALQIIVDSLKERLG